MVQGVQIQNGQIQNINPSTGQLIEPPVPITTPSQLVETVSKANQAQTSWSQLSLSQRINLLRDALDNLDEMREDLSNLITTEMGKVSSEAQEEINDAISLKDEWLDLIQEANQEIHLQSDEGSSIIIRDVLGVVVVLSPWNFPVGEIILLVLPALAAGNAVIVKPSEVTPLCGAAVCEAMGKALPEGVLQVVQGDGMVGEQLVNDNIHMVAMTGSSAVGKKIMKQCADKLKRVVLELGGKDPMIVFADADLDKAAEDAVTNSLFNAGQVCCSVERVYVEEGIKARFEERVVELAKGWKVGNPLDESVKIGPMVSRVQMEIVKEQVSTALDAGAKLLYESDVPRDGGNFYPVTVLTDVTQNMTIQNNETFGPIISISTFDGSEKEAIHLANDTEYGLASYVYTSDLKKGASVARRIRSGQVGINCYSMECAHSKCPWVGHKMSGIGSHSGMDGFRSFSVPKSLVFTTGAPTLC